MGLLLWIIPIAAIAALLLPGSRRLKHAISIAASALAAAVGVLATIAVIRDGSLQYVFPAGLFYIDAVSIISLDIVLLIGLLTSIYTVGYVENEITQDTMKPAQVRMLYALIQAFILTMILTLTVRNIGVMWIAIEATTLASVFLVGFHNNKSSVEAAWKYIIICSVGITLAMMGVIFINSAAVGALGEADSLDWTVLYRHAAELDGPLLRFAFIFILIGFGTKAGLAPMHTWLPDTYGQAPSPMPLLSGVLLNAGMYAIIRTVAIVNKNLGESTFTGTLLIVTGILSILAAALFILTQKNYKRLLAYSSIEHMGLIAIAVGLFSPASIFAAFFHTISHSLTKSMLFLTAGSIQQKYGTRNIGKIRGLIKTLPVTGTVFLIGLIAIGGTPPFGVFASEFSVLAALFAAGRPVLGAIIALLMSLVFVGIIYAVFRIFFVGQASDVPAPTPGENNKAGTAAAALLLIGVILIGFLMPDWLRDLLNSAQRIVTGG